MVFPENGKKFFKFVVTERIIAFLTRGIDVLMLFFLGSDPELGVYKCFFICGALYLLFCGIVVGINDWFLSRGMDITGLDDLRNMAYRTYDRRQYVKRFASWIMKRRSAILWIGSWFYIDPDYVTILLRKPGSSFWNDFLKITLPSVSLSMLVWTTVYWLGVEGFKWALFLM